MWGGVYPVGLSPGFFLLGAADGAFSILELAGNGISVVLLIFTILEFCIAVATANFWCRATRLSSNEVGHGGQRAAGETPAQTPSTVIPPPFSPPGHADRAQHHAGGPGRAAG